jgi:hypothetical protein
MQAQRAIINRIINNAIRQIGLVEADKDWIMKDLKSMRVSLQTKNIDIDKLLNNKEEMIKQVWTLGKAHELLNRGLLRSDGTLSREALEYLNKQRRGEIPSGLLPGEAVIELSVLKVK